MRFSETIAHIAVALRDSPGVYANLTRSLREGAESEALQAEERELARKHGHPIKWGPQGFGRFLRGKSGPGPDNGVQTTPIVLANFIIGCLTACPNNEVAQATLLMSYAATRDRGKTRYFLPEFAAILADPELFARCSDVGVSVRRGFAHIDLLPVGRTAGPGGPWFPEGVRTTFVASTFDTAPDGRFSIDHFYPWSVAQVMPLTGIWSAPRQAGRKKQKALLHA